jgi:uridine kinase
LGIVGGSGSGKTTLVAALTERLGPENTCTLAFDAYYLDQGHLELEERHRVNYDHPDSLDTDLYNAHVRELAAGRSVQMPLYDFATHRRTSDTVVIEAAPYVLAEGILVLAIADVREALDCSVYLQTPADVRLERRIIRDSIERGRSEASVRAQFDSSVQPMHAAIVDPSEEHADVVVSHPFTVEDGVSAATDLLRRYHLGEISTG